jgi:hypothetical protein
MTNSSTIDSNKLTELEEKLKKLEELLAKKKK